MHFLNCSVPVVNGAPNVKADSAHPVYVMFEKSISNCAVVCGDHVCLLMGRDWGTQLLASVYLQLYFYYVSQLIFFLTCRNDKTNKIRSFFFSFTSEILLLIGKSIQLLSSYHLAICLAIKASEREFSRHVLSGC